MFYGDVKGMSLLTIPGSIEALAFVSTRFENESLQFPDVQIALQLLSSSGLPYKLYLSQMGVSDKQLKSGGRNFMDEVHNRDLALVRSVPYTMQYWQERSKELFPMITLLGKLRGLLTPSVAESTLGQGSLKL
ncbi:hypothetical protein MRX96_035739 [Rhipicephalus microplus]